MKFYINLEESRNFMPTISNPISRDLNISKKEKSSRFQNLVSAIMRNWHLEINNLETGISIFYARLSRDLAKKSRDAQV